MFRILVVEDHQELRQLFVRVLEKNGYTALSWGGNAELIVDELLANGVSLEEAILDPDLADVLDADEENEVYQDDGMLQYDLDQAYRLENGLSDDLDDEDFSSRNWSDLI